MMLHAVQREIQDLNALLLKSDQFLVEADLEVAAHWAQYLCIRVASNLDTCITSIFIEYARVNGNEQIRRYIENRLSRFNNLRPRKIIQLHQDFKPLWGRSVKSFLKDEKKWDTIESIVNNRNRIAHGESAEISIENVRVWFKECQTVIEYVDNLVLRD